MASPHRRLPTNVAGDFYVDDTCIDCGTCRWMAPDTFDHRDTQSRVHRQPADEAGAFRALQALVACPTASIGTAPGYDVAAAADSFPSAVAPGVYHCGYHSEDSFGAASYLVVRPGGNVMVDSPRFTPRLIRAIEALGGVDLLFLTHRDDVADHERLTRHFGCRRVLHRDDVGGATRSVEVQPHGIAPVELGPDLTMIPVPGHTAGSACLLYDSRVLFTGDHLAWSRSRARLYAFEDACWYDWREQTSSMRRLRDYTFEHVLPGHGAPCRLAADEMRRQLQDCIDRMEGRPGRGDAPGASGS